MILWRVMPGQQRKSILCPNCRKLINVDEARCPYCGTSRPGALWKRALDLRVMRGTDQLIQWIIFINVGMYILSLLLSPSSIHLKNRNRARGSQKKEALAGRGQHGEGRQGEVNR